MRAAAVGALDITGEYFPLLRMYACMYVCMYVWTMKLVSRVYRVNFKIHAYSYVRMRDGLISNVFLSVIISAAIECGLRSDTKGQ